jgi:hypothetical protein
MQEVKHTRYPINTCLTVAPVVTKKATITPSEIMDTLAMSARICRLRSLKSSSKSPRALIAIAPESQALENETANPAQKVSDVIKYTLVKEDLLVVKITTRYTGSEAAACDKTASTNPAEESLLFMGFFKPGFRLVRFELLDFMFTA